MIMRMQLQNFKSCVPDLGDSGKQRPDLLIFEPERMPGKGNETFYDSIQWSLKVIAVEVETDPTKHGSQVVRNFNKNFEVGYDVWFIVFSAKHMQYIIDIMEKNGIERRFYRITVVPPESVERFSNVQNNSVAHLTREELEVYNALGHGRTARSIAEIVGMSSYDIMGILWRLEKKGMAERGYAETRKIGVDTRQGRTVTETRRHEYFLSKAIEMPKLQEPIDFSKFADEELRELVLHPRYGSFAKKLLENRGNEVLITDDKVELRKKANRS